jgi:hypothetical protein
VLLRGRAAQCAVSDGDPWQCLNFLPEPHGHTGGPEVEQLIEGAVAKRSPLP